MRSVLPEIDALVVLDQVSRRNCGVITDMIRDALALLAQEFPNVLVYADSRAHIGSFRGVVIKANSREAILAAGLVHTTHADDAQVWAAADELQRRTDRPVFITMGERGMLVATRERKVLVSGVPVSGPIDVTGAGDSATAGIVLSLAAGADLTQAAAVGNLVASITIEQLGTTGTASREQVLARFDASRIGQETP
jgi:bifunctional ADP-heptose synthase (sugar kinase/adenylyltransferase)